MAGCAEKLAFPKFSPTSCHQANRMNPCTCTSVLSSRTLFDTAAGPYQLKFKWAVEKNTEKNYTIFLKASIYTTTENYITWTGADFLFDLDLSYDEECLIAFGYRYDSTSILETSQELYHFPMCYEYLSDINNKEFSVQFYYKLTSSEWSTIESNFTTEFTPSITSTPSPGFISGFNLFLVLSIISVVIIYKSFKLKKKRPMNL